MKNCLFVMAGAAFAVGCVSSLVPSALAGMRGFFSQTLGETVVVTNYADAKADFAFFDSKLGRDNHLLIEETAADADHVRFTFRADPPLGAYFRYSVPGNCIRPRVVLNGKVRDGVTPGRLNWIWRKWRDGDVLELDFSAKGEVKRGESGRAAWMRGRYGIMVHWLFPSAGDVDRWTDAFDLDGFMADFDRTGADWLVFTAGQCTGAYCSPNAAFDGFCGPGHTSKRDLLSEIATAVKKRGKRFIVYSACDFVRDGCDDHAMQKGLGWDNASEDRRTFQARWPRVLREWAVRLGRNCDGWWLDGVGVQYPNGVDFAVWEAACRAGNPAAALAFNPGSNEFSSYGPSDYAAGETSSLKWIVADPNGLEPVDAVRHYLFPIDGYWGGFWPWPDGEWAGVRHLLKTRPEMFDAAKLEAMSERGEFPDPIYTAEELRRYLAFIREHGGAATINVGIDAKGRINPKSIELIRKETGK